MVDTPVSINTRTSSTVVHINVKQDCPVQYVTVYNDRAEMTRLLRHHFDNAGTYDLVLEGFSPCVDQTSFHVGDGTGKACTILEVSYQTRYENPSTSSTDTAAVDQLQQELDLLQNEIDEHGQEVDRLKKQQTWLDGRASKLMNQEESMNNISLDTIKQFLDFYHDRLSKIDKEINAQQRKLKDLNGRCDALRAKISEHGTVATTNRQIKGRDVTISVDIVRSNVDVALEVSYLISNCAWNPSYDVRVNSSEGGQPKTQLTYYGIIVSISFFLLQWRCMTML